MIPTAVHTPAQASVQPSPSSLVVRRCSCGGTPGPSGECAACREKRLSLRRDRGAPAATGVPESVEATLRTEGEPLGDGVRRALEPRFRHDFSRVRVHTDVRAAASARDVGAEAYAAGSHVVFGPGRYRPGTPEGTKLLAHELAHVVQAEGAVGSSLALGDVGDPAEREAETAAERALAGSDPTVAPRPPALRRYHHEDCTESDLSTHIWPADGIARSMVTKAVRILGASSIDPAVAPLFPRYFQTSTPSYSSIKDVFDKVDTEMTGNDYTYECEDDCDDENAYVYGIWTDVHLCMNHLRGKANDCIARTIVHEFTHYAAGTDDEENCYTAGCRAGNCPASLSESDALDNAYSFAGFAYDLYPMSV